MRDLSLSGKSDQQSIKSQLKPSSDDAAEKWPTLDLRYRDREYFILDLKTSYFFILELIDKEKFYAAETTILLQ